MKNIFFILLFLLFSSTAIAQIGYNNYLLNEALDNIVVKLKSSGIAFEKTDGFEYERIKIIDGKFVHARNEFESIFGDDSDKPFVAQITCTQICFVEDSIRNITLNFDYKNKLMQINVDGIDLEFAVLKQAMIKKYGEPVNTYNMAVFNIPKFTTIIEIHNSISLYAIYKNTELIDSHFLKQYKEQEIAANAEIEKKSEKANEF